MRVVVTVPNWTLNGVNTFCARLVRVLRTRGIEMELLLTGSLWRDDKPLPLPGDVSIERLRLPAIPTWGARCDALRRHLERRAPCIYLPNHDILHSGISPTLSSRVGIVGIAHSDDPQHYAHARRLGRWWNAVVGVSDRITAELRGFPELAHAHVAHIPYGVSLAPGGVERGTDAGDPLRIVYAGRLEEPQKRTHDLIEVARMLRDRGVPFALTVAGNGPSRQSLEWRARALGLEGEVRFVGTLPPDELPALYRAHDVFLLPSAFEGLPLALLEAMAEGCIPVVSAIASGVPELVQDGVTGCLVPVGDVAGFASVLASLWGDRTRRRSLAAQGRGAIELGGFDEETMAGRYERLLGAVWDDVASGRYARSSGAAVAPPSLDWRVRMRAPFAAWRERTGGGR